MLAASRLFGLFFSLNALQQHAGRFIVRVLRHKFAAKRLGHDGLVKMVDHLRAFVVSVARRSIQEKAFSIRSTISRCSSKGAMGS